MFNSNLLVIEKSKMIMNLFEKEVDYIISPSYVSVFKDTNCCPNIIAITDIVTHSELNNPKIIGIRVENDFSKALNDVGRKLSKDKKKIKKAVIF